jgi:chromosome segregation ATPase
MNSRLFVCTGFLAACIACQSDRADLERSREESTETAKAARKEAERARDALARRLDHLDSEIEKLEKKADKATGKAKAKLREQSQELRADSRKLRDRMTTWDDKVESAWRTTRREVEEGIDKTENAIKNLVDDVKN